MRKFGLIFVMVMLAFTFIGCDNGMTGNGGTGDVNVVSPELRGTFRSATPVLAAGYSFLVIGETTMRRYTGSASDGSNKQYVSTDNNVRSVAPTIDGTVARLFRGNSGLPPVM